MLRRACSQVRVVPFKRPEELMERVALNAVKLTGLVERHPHKTGGLIRTALLVPNEPQRLSPSSLLASLPSSTPCSLVFLDLYSQHISKLPYADLAPAKHILVSGDLLQLTLPAPVFRVIVRNLLIVHDAIPCTPHSDIDPSTLLALVASIESRWHAYFHSPSDWYEYHTQPHGRLAFVHKYTGVRLWTSSYSPSRPGR